MAYDSHRNFSYSLVATAPSPATSGTSLVVTGGEGALFPAVPFNATVWPAGVRPTSTNAEIVRVTNISTDTLTITRAQESTSAVSIAIGYQIAATLTKKTITDLEAQATADGWQDANEAWAYDSATTIAVPSGATSKYSVGDRIKLTQSATVKYFVVTGVASTTLTIATSTDYVFTNNAITLNYYSHANPVGFPASFAYAPTWTNLTPGNGTTNVATFSIQGKRLFGRYKFTLGSSSVVSSFPTLTVPVTIAGSYGSYESLGLATFSVGGTIYRGVVAYNSGSIEFEPMKRSTTYVDYDFMTANIPATWAAGDYLSGEFSYYIA